MRIGLDARLLFFTQAGIGLYTARLLRALLAADQSNRYVEIRDRRDTLTLAKAPNLSRFDTFTPAHSPFESVALPMELTRLRLDVLHSTDFVAPRTRRCRTVATVHDLAFMLYPHLVTDESRRYYSRVDTTTQRADAIIAVSERTRRDVVRLLGVRPDKVHVVHHAADARFQPIDDTSRLSSLCSQYSLPERFLLFVGTLEPRKNLVTLLEALAASRRWWPEAQLVVVGQQGWLFEDVPARIDSLGLRDRVHFTGQIPTADLVGLYNMAEAFVFPSLYEGFGFPVLEAMACGTPVISSNAACLPEIVGDGGLLFEPLDATALEERLRAVLEDPAERARLVTAGRSRAAEFSWEKTARATLAVYEGVSGERARAS